MPTLDWLNRAEALTLSDKVPYRVLDPVSEHHSPRPPGEGRGHPSPAPAGSRYDGRWEFKKHYYPVIANLKDKGEEFECARFIDRHAKVKHWVRNLEQEPFGFWLPTAQGRFFPDFIAELVDGRLAVIEYKGAHLRTLLSEIEKRKVGELWATSSGGKCVFRFVYLDDGGLNMQGQIDKAFA